MGYRNKTFVSFASEDIGQYRLMTAWRANPRFEFDFYDAHDLNIARDTSSPETINRRLRERLGHTKQVVMLIGDVTRTKAARVGSFIGYEVRVIQTLDVPVIFANLNGSRGVDRSRIPSNLLEIYSVSVSFSPYILKYALDHFPDDYRRNKRLKVGPHYYKGEHYTKAGL